MKPTLEKSGMRAGTDAWVPGETGTRSQAYTRPGPSDILGQQPDGMGP